MSARLRAHGTTLALTVLAAAAGVVVLVTDRGHVTTDEQQARRRSLLPLYRGDDVTEVDLDLHDKHGRLLRGAPSDAGQRPWEIEIDGARHAADEAMVDKLLGSLRDGSTERSFKIEPSERKAFGLESSRGSITLVMGGQKLRVVLGGPAPTPPGALYAQVEGSEAERGAVITAELAAALDIVPDDLRQRALVTWEASDLDALTLEGEGGTRKLTRAPWKTGRGASFRTEDGTRASTAALDRIWEALAQMKADAFLAPAEADRALARKVTVTLSPHGAKPVVIDVGGACPGHEDDVVAVRRAEGSGPLAACVPEGVLDALSTPAADLADRRVVGARADEVIDVKLSFGTLTIALARTGTQWHEQQPVDRPIDAEVGRAFLERLLAVEGRQFFDRNHDPKLLGLHQPYARVRVASATGDGEKDRIEEIELGAQEDGMMPVRRVEDGAVLVVPVEAADALLADEIALRSHKIFDEPTQTFTSIRVVGPRGVQRFARSREGAWEAQEPVVAGLPPDPGLISELANAVGKLSAESWVHAPPKFFVPEKPALAIQVETASGKKLAVNLGIEATGGGVYARVEGEDAVFVAPQALAKAADRWLFTRTALLPDVERITRVTLAGEGGKKLVLEANGGALRVAGSRDPGDTARANEVRSALAELVAEGVVSLGAPLKGQGFEKAALVVTIEEQGKKAREIRFGAGDSQDGTAIVYARVAKVDATFAVAQGKVKPLMEAVK